MKSLEVDKKRDSFFIVWGKYIRKKKLHDFFSTERKIASKCNWCYIHSNAQAVQLTTQSIKGKLKPVSFEIY